MDFIKECEKYYPSLSLKLVYPKNPKMDIELKVSFSKPVPAKIKAAILSTIKEHEQETIDILKKKLIDQFVLGDTSPLVVLSKKGPKHKSVTGARSIKNVFGEPEDA